MFRNTAHLYDLLYHAAGKDYEAESSVVHHLIEDHSPEARTLLDVACGTGSHILHLRPFYDVTGVDIDPGMLAEARARLPDLPFLEADMRTLDLGLTFDAVICLFSSIGYLRSTDELNAAIASMAHHLRPGGVLIVDGWVRPDAWIDGGKTEVMMADDHGRRAGPVGAAAGAGSHSGGPVGAGPVRVVRMSRSWRDGDRTSLEMHHLIDTGDGIEHVVDVHELTLFTPDDYDAAFGASGLPVEIFESPMPGRDRYVAVRPATP